MKLLPASLQSHLDSGATTLAWCWRLTRRDGTRLGFTGMLAGFVIDRVLSARDALDPLQLAFFIDARESDGRIVFAQRGSELPAADLAPDLLVERSADQALATLTRAQETDLPSSAKLTFISAAGDYPPAVEEVRDDEVAWCAAFVGACLERAGVACTRSLMARSYLAWGDALDEARTGAIAVLSRGSDPSLGHVGFLAGLTDSSIVLLAGNQGDAVSVQAFPRARLVGLRWPSSAAATPPAPPVIPDGASAPIRDPATDAIFERALAHVLEMEGGYDEDPYDPGGPTNLGITLAEFVRDKGIELTSDNFAAMKGELRAIPRDTVRRIYHDNYWQAAACPELPPGLALFHFDAAVNQGVAGAARMLQQAVGAEVDGEIGPLTLAAVASHPVEESLSAYAEVRRRRYRALPTFWRFGKGWLSRVDATLALAGEIDRATPPLVPPQPKGPTMPTDTSTATSVTPDAKWWGHSLTIWGVIVTGLSTVLPAIGPALGINITADLIHQLGDNVVSVAQAVGGLAGTVMAIYGRLRTSTPLERRQVTLSM